MNHHGQYKVPGGKLVIADYRVEGGRLADVSISGDFFLFPDEAIYLINASLIGMPVDSSIDEYADRVRGALSENVEMLGFDAVAIAEAVRRGME